MPTRPFTALQLTLAYIASAAAWLLATHWLLVALDVANAPLAVIEPVKGLIFVAVSGALLYRWARRVRSEAAAEHEALRISEQQYRLVSEYSQDVIWMLSPEGKITYISPSIERLLGHPPARMLQMSLSEFLTPDSCRRAQAEIEEAIRQFNTSGQTRTRLLALEQIRADGSTVWTEVNTTNFKHGHDGRPAILGVTRDISQRRAVEQALAREVARCRALLDVSVDAIHVLDLEGRLLEANETFLRERGFTRAMIPTLRCDHWDATHSHQQIRALIGAVGSEVTFFETTHRHGDGTLFAVEGQAKRVEHDGRAMIYVTVRDVTERRELEQRLLRSQRLESVGLIASGIAHDLNNVLTPILLSTGLLEMRYPAPEDAALLKPIEAAARRGSNIVQQILTFARGADGQRVSVEPRVLLKELSNLIRETFPRNIVHCLTIEADTARVIGDPTQLHQVLLNLALNARDAMPQGGTLKIEARNRRLTDSDVRVIPSGRPGDFVCITVADTGTGMTSEVLDHVFEPFFTTKPRGRGTGLGLSTVHGLVRGHGGFVEVDSKLGHGSEFRVFLPAAAAASPVDAPAPAAPAEPLGRGEHILVIDDESSILTVLASVLQRHGFVALTATDGNEAINLLDRHRDRIAAVVTDVMMPGLDGVRLAAAVRQRSPDLPIIAMSGMISPTAEDENRQQLRALGVTTVLDKPYGELELLEAIRGTLVRTCPA